MGASLKIPSELDKRSALFGLFLFAAIFLGAGLAMDWFLFLHPWLESRAAQSWMPTPCQINLSGLKSHPGKSTTYSVYIAYSYEFNGQKYQSDRYDFTEGSSSARGWRQAAVNQHPAHSAAVCYVNPQNPTEAVLNADFGDKFFNVLFPGVFTLVGLGLMVPVALGVLRRNKFGESFLDINDAPVPVGGALEGTVNLNRVIQPAEGFAVKLSCIHRIVTRTGKDSNTQEIVLWQDLQQVQAESGGSVPLSFALPDSGAETNTVSSRDRTFWRLEVKARVPGIDYAAQFEIPVVRAALSPEQAAEAKKLRALSGEREAHFQLPAHSRIRVQDTADGKEFYFPALRNPGMAFFLALFSAIWTGVVWLLISSGAPVLFPIVFGLFDIPVLLFAASELTGTARITANGNGVTLRKGLLGVGWARTIPATDIREISVGIGATMGTTVYYNVQVVRQNGNKTTAGSEVPDAHEAHWLALEMAQCAGVGNDPT